MFDIVNFQFKLSDTASKSYSIYQKLYEQNLVVSPIIYSDINTVFIGNNIPIFSTFYLREIFSDKYILLDYEDYKYVPQNLKEKCIIVYNRMFQNIENLPKFALCIELEQDAIKSIMEYFKYESV
jgi:hypothetical protein